MGLTVGSDGSYPYGNTEGNDFAKNLAAPDIDFGVYHLYVGDCKNNLLRFLSTQHTNPS